MRAQTNPCHPSLRHRFGVRLALLGIVSFAVVASIAAAVPSASAATMSVRRFAVIIGSNDGGGSRVKLRYAGTDAKGFAGVLKTLGGLSTSDTVLVEDANIAQVRAAFQTIAARITSSTSPSRQARTEVVVYYSGHSDEKGLLPGGALLTYTELRQLVKTLPADVRIVVLDSCASGALIRTKGGKKRPGFMVDASSNVKGQAIITSASADEQAQESDRIGASFFTHHLVSGLRGAADSDGDGKVTLSEAYKHAFHETLRKTQGTASGPQHPNYDISLAGTGDVVITSLRSHRSMLVLSSGLRGRLFVRDSANRLVVELEKASGRKTELGLSPGTYQLMLRRKSTVEVADVVLRDGSRTAVSRKQFAAQLAAVHRTRGGRVILATPPRNGRRSLRYVGIKEVEVNRGVRIPTARPAPMTPVGEDLPPPTPPSPQVAPSTTSTAVAPPAQAQAAAAGAKPALAHPPSPTEGTIAESAGTAKSEAGEGPSGATVGASFQLVPGMGSGWDTDRTVAKFSLNLIAGRNGSVSGLELGMVNLINYDLSGLQMGLWNHVERHVGGVQMGGLVNVAGGLVTGMQLGTLVNVAGQLQGAQLGVVNVLGKGKGLMLGLVNVADSLDGVALGVLNVIDDGYQRFEAWTSDTHAVALGYKLGGQALYTSLFVGADPYHDMRLSFGLGIGFHASLADRLSLDTDVTAAIGFQTDDVATRGLEPVALMKLRVTVAYRLAKSIGIFGGLTVNTALAWESGRYEMSLFGDIGTVGEQPFDPTFTDPGLSVSVWPGFVVGLQL